jgi:hypothetical protein
VLFGRLCHRSLLRKTCKVKLDTPFEVTPQVECSRFTQL